jgi:hypothetical protein
MGAFSRRKGAATAAPPKGQSAAVFDEASLSNRAAKVDFALPG